MQEECHFVRDISLAVINNKSIWQRFPIHTTAHETSVNINTTDKAEHKILQRKICLCTRGTEISERRKQITQWRSGTSRWERIPHRHSWENLKSKHIILLVFYKDRQIHTQLRRQWCKGQHKLLSIVKTHASTVHDTEANISCGLSSNTHLNRQWHKGKRKLWSVVKTHASIDHDTKANICCGLSSNTHLNRQWHKGKHKLRSIVKTHASIDHDTKANISCGLLSNTRISIDSGTNKT